MVSIPSGQIKNIIYSDESIKKEKALKVKSYLNRKSVLEEAENKGYFVNVTAEFLNERFNVKGNYQSISDNENIKVLKHITFIDLHQTRIQRLMCLEYCTGVVYLNLAGNCISDIGALKACGSLVCLDLSSNLINGLPGIMFWESLRSLRILYIHDNPISEPDSVMGICGCHNLTLLTLSNTPLSLKRKYRHFLVNSVWSLKVLDNYLVSDEEIIEDSDFKLSLFRSQSDDLKIQSYRTFYARDAMMIETLLRLFLAEINRLVSHISPVVIIQKWVRGFNIRKGTKASTKHSKLREPSPNRIVKPAEELPKAVSAPRDEIKYLKIDLKHLNTSLTIENLDREAFLMDSMDRRYNSFTYRSLAKSDQDKCSKEQISRALKKDDDSISIGTTKPSEVQENISFRLSGVNFPSSKKDPAAEVMIEKNRSHYVIREADRMFHENKLSFILPEIKSRPVVKTNSNILFRKSRGCMGLFLLNKWEKTDHAVMEMDTYHDRVSKIDAIKFEREMKLQDVSEATMNKLMNIRRSHEEHKKQVSQSAKLESEIMQAKVEELRMKQEDTSRQKTKIKNEISFSHNFRSKQSAASNAIDRVERMAIKSDQIQANISNVADIKESMAVKMEWVKSYVENQICNKRTEKNLEQSALDIQLFQQMNNRMNDAKKRVEKLKTIHRLVSCPKLKVIQVNLDSIPTL